MSFASIMKLLAALALLAMPLGMVTGGQAMASGVASEAMGHCEEMRRHKSDPTDRITDCAIGCAAIVAEPGEVPLCAAALPRTRIATLAATLHGLGPQAATPPPRHS